MIDLYEELHNNHKEAIILFEGAQGFGLDIDWGDYPFVTSSHCTTAGALLNGLPPQSIRDVFGVAKAYDTYVGAKNFHGTSDVFNKIQKVGAEFGATTGRPRQCNWLNLDNLKKASDINGTTTLIINKVDILRKINRWGLIKNDKELSFISEIEWKKFIKKSFKNIRICFSDSPKRV